MISAQPFELTLHVDVRAQHIARGIPGACTCCPLSLAIPDAVRAAGYSVPDHSPVMVLGDLVKVSLAGVGYCIAELPMAARLFIRHFDHGPQDRLRPFRFDVTLTPGEFIPEPASAREDP